MSIQEIDHNELLKEIKDNYSMAIVTLEDMTKIIYSKSNEIKCRDINELEYLGLFGSAYRYNNGNAMILEWLKKSIKYLVIYKVIDKKDIEIILHHTLINERNKREKLSLRAMLENA